MTATILRSTSAITDASRSRLERDPVLGLENWFACYDFTDDWCNPSTSTEPYANNTRPFRNMSRDIRNPSVRGPDLTISNPESAIRQASNRGGLIFPAGDYSTNNWLRLETITYADVRNHDYLVIIWDNQPTQGFNTANNAPIYWDGDSPNNASVLIDSGIGGNQIRGVVGTGNGFQEVVAGHNGQGAPRQIAFAREGTQLSIYLNGQLTRTGTAPGSLRDTRSTNTYVAGNHGATIYKVAACTLNGQYDRPVQEIVETDWISKPLGLRS